MLYSKITEKINTYFNSVHSSMARVPQAQVKMDQNDSLLNRAQEEVQLKNALLDSGLEALNADIAESKDFIKKTKGQVISPDNVDEFILPEEMD